VDEDVRMVTFIGKEGRYTSGSTQSIVVSELREQKQRGPVVFLVVAKNAEVLFQGLVGTFGLTITFRVIARGKMQSHVERFSKRAEKAGDEFQTSIGGDMFRYSVFGEHMQRE
jgi:hypothetical protein